MTDNNEYQLGVHDVDTSGSITDESNVVEFDVETEAVFKRLADDIYQTAEAGVREPLMNAITSVRRAFDGDLTEGVIKITVQEGDQVTLRLQDNGLGITENILENVLTVIGRSDVRDDGKLAGQYGMGFLASYKLVGTDGGFLMHTNPRDGESYKGMFRPGAFEPDTEGSLPNILGDQHGTAFEYYVKESISTQDIREWVETHARWSPVSVIYKEMDEDGVEKYNEDFGSESLVSESQTGVQVDTEHFEAVATPDASGETILITSPMKMSHRNRLSENLPWKIDIRLKYENGIIVDGPHRGQAPVSEQEYNSMEEGRRDGYVPKNRLSDEDIRLPQPIGTREKLRADRDFVEHVNEKIADQVQENLQEVCETFNPKQDDYRNLSGNQRSSIGALSDAIDRDKLSDFVSASSVPKHGDKKEKVSKKLSDLLPGRDFDPDDPIVQFMLYLSEKIRQTIPDDTERRSLYEYTSADESYDNTFVCVSSSTWKSTAVDQSNKDIRLLSVPRSSWYADLEAYFGWEPLKRLDKNRVIQDLGLSGDDVKSIRGRSTGDTEVKNKKVKIRTGSRKSHTYTAEKIREDCEDDIPYDSSSEYLLLFPRGAEENISDNTDLADGYVGIASCPQDVYEYLVEDRDHIIHYNDYLSTVDRTVENTSEGELQLSEIASYSNLLVLPTESGSTLQRAVDTDLLDVVSRQVADENGLDIDSTILTSADSDTWNRLITINILHNKFNEFLQVVCQSNNRYYSYTGIRPVRTNLIKTYAKEKFTQSQVDQGLIESLDVKFDGLTPTALSWIRKISAVSGAPEQNSTNSNLPKHQTSEGAMNIKEIYETHDPSSVLIHVLDPSDIDPFQDRAFIDEANENLAGQMVITDRYQLSDNVFYVPVLRSSYRTIKSEIDGDTDIIGYVQGDFRRTRETNEQWYHACIYASVRLPKWSDRKVSSLVNDLHLEQAITLTDNIKPIHDNGGQMPMSRNSIPTR